MRGLVKQTGTLAVGVLIGALLCSSAAFGYAKYNAWGGFGPEFRLGYVVGYLDGVTLGKRKDGRTYMSWLKVPYEQWRDAVDEYYEDLSRRKDPLPTAMYNVYLKFLTQKYPEMGERLRRILPKKGRTPAWPPNLEEDAPPTTSD